MLSVDKYVKFTEEVKPGDMLRIKLSGDEEWYLGVTLDRPRKMWVKIAKFYGENDYIADENCIEDWEFGDIQNARI